MIGRLASCVNKRLNNSVKQSGREYKFIYTFFNVLFFILFILRLIGY